ncbi:tRNA(adenine(34)) deaminase, chloroplastic [Punica granatum]|uniref:tRNA(adenine(34)) deaminase n=2 Tax=Punica granatum TaxID=22663 RepID=A0A218WTK5_PUNGR|nr:tRNA(adenine(34)) deaminase, chloroplastic [Punica granatum]OWM75839.1 hypothetical protein CDL15_Pgr009483 [Punica granatum]PKI53139.1 hypothetical protein CRG98_026444 [Punica granatum]
MYSSTVLSLRAKGSASFPFTDHSHSPLADRVDRCGVHFSLSSSSSCCYSCCCCACACCGHGRAAAHGVPVSATFLYGLRQSSLLQRSASRRLILGGGGDRQYYQVPGYGVGRDHYESSCVFKERGGEGGGRGRRRKVIQCMVSEENSEIRRLSQFEEAEAVLSLLIEEVDVGSFGGGERKGASTSKRVEMEKKKIYGSECSKGRKRNVRSDLAERDSKHRLESVAIESREECHSCKMKRERESRQEGGKMRKDASDCSSYYSVSSSGDFESGSEEIRDAKFQQNSSASNDEDSSAKERSRMRKEPSEELKRNEEVGEKDAVLQRKGSTLRSNAEWDSRKKSEKKLDEVSMEETQSTKESSLVPPSILRTHGEDDYQKASTSRRQFTGVDEKLDVSVNLDSRGRRSIYSRTENDAVALSELRKKTEKSADVCKVCGSDVTLSSQSREQLGMREENVAVSTDSVGQARDDSLKAVRRSPQQLSAGVRVQEIDSEAASKLQRESDTRVSNRQESKSLTSGSAQKREQQKKVQKDEQIIKQSDMRRSQQHTELSECHQNIERTYISNRQRREENTNLVSSSVSNHREQYSQTTQEEAYCSKRSRDESTDLTSKSSHRVNEGETALSSQRTSEQKMADRRSNITVVVNVGDGVSKSRGGSSERVMQTESQNEGTRLTKVFSSPVNVPRMNRQAEPQIGDDKDSSTLISTTQPPQGRVPAYIRQTGRVEASESKFTGLWTPELKPEVESEHRGDGAYGTPLNLVAPEDALESAQRFDQLSNQVVGEFIEKARHEVLSSELQLKTSETELTDRRQDQTQTSSSRFGSEVKIKGGHSRSSLRGSGTKGPSDEIWLETKISAQEPPKAEAEPPENIVGSGQAIVKRTGRSLWNIIADIVRLRWGSHAETPHSTSRRGKKSSSNESASSEAWFSGREQGSTPAEAITPLHRIQSTSASVKSQAESSSSDKNRLFEEQVSSPLTSGTSSASQVTSSTNIQEDYGTHEYMKQLESSGTPFSIELVEPSASAVEVEATVGAGGADLSLGGSMEKMEPPAAKLTMVSGMEGKSGALKQREFQRARQVPKDRFDEWEEAYKLESEQCRIDEMFMREALIEAKKAADNWEVPVGAVLVQHGKIIARGYNLVEELRDSTAHAEMICIREASNVLRSWRLADSTLYVTLEPCPMCAGAILQARVDTLVWGAPNKLLGADGSWIRLFPIGEGSSGSETAEKPAPPAHPFHPNMTIRRGVLASECADTMQQFFQLRRKKKEKKPEEPETPPSCLPVAPHPSKLLHKMHDIFHITFCL